MHRQPSGEAPDSKSGKVGSIPTRCAMRPVVLYIRVVSVQDIDYVNYSIVDSVWRSVRNFVSTAFSSILQITVQTAQSNEFKCTI